jgi:hypothetical protein
VQFQADLAIYDSKGQFVLLVEVKQKLSTDIDWAAKMRRNLLAHNFIPDTRFFLLACPDRFYLWKDAGSEPTIVEPNYVIDPSSFLRPFLKKADISSEKISHFSLEMTISSWLNKLLYLPLPEDVDDETQKLIDSGLVDAIKGGRVEYEVAV